MCDMLDASSLCQLYTNVLNHNIIVNQVSDQNIRAGIRCMGKAYSSEGANFNSNDQDVPNFNRPAFRCAYLHKYASLHTYIVFEVMRDILEKKKHVFQQLVRSGNFNFCCLGGGPGTDVIGVMAALYTAFNYFTASASVIDCMKEWECTFKTIILQLSVGINGEVWRNLAANLQCRYVGANLLNNMTSEVYECIGEASFVTMVKFVSAATCTSTEEMLEKIFRIMKPGAIVLFIDNAAGGFTQAVERASKKNSFKAVMPPRRHVCYENEDFKIQRFGYTSCSKSTVTILLLQKPSNLQNDNISFAPHISPSYYNPFPKENINPKITVPNLNIIIDANYNSEKTLSNSHKLPIKDNLNNLNQQKKVSIKSKRIAPTNPQSPTRRGNLNSLSTKTGMTEAEKIRNDYYRNIPSSSSGMSPRSAAGSQTNSSFSYYPTSAPRSAALSQTNSTSNYYPSAPRRSAARSQTRSTSSYYPSSAPRKRPSQQSDDDENEDETSCTCCVIS